MGDPGAVSLSEMLCDRSNVTKDVAFLDVRGNDIGDRGALALSRVLEKREDNKLVYFDMRWNRVFAEGARYISRALADNTSLTVLNLRQNK